jgi:hypothetical protein
MPVACERMHPLILKASSGRKIREFDGIEEEL